MKKQKMGEIEKAYQKFAPTNKQIFNKKGKVKNKKQLQKATLIYGEYLICKGKSPKKVIPVIEDMYGDYSKGKFPDLRVR